MRSAMIGALALLMGSSVVAAEELELKSDQDKLSYVFGYQLGQRMAADGIEVNADIYNQAFREGLAGKTMMLSPEEVQLVMENFQKRGQERMREMGERNLQAGKDYLAANSGKEGVEVLESGLQYKIIKQGEGNKPKATDTVKVHYRGTLIDGREFDSSYSRGEPATFPVNRVIAGWTEILQQMPVGSHYQVVIPADKAYGERGAPPMIGPNSVLIFEIELLSIEG